MGEFLQQYLGQLLMVVITTGIGGFFGWFYERKRKKVEVKNLEAEGSKVKADYSKSIVDLYQEALIDMKNQYEERYNFLKREYDLKFENMSFKMAQLEKDQEMWKNKYSSLKKEFDAYKKKHQ